MICRKRENRDKKAFSPEEYEGEIGVGGRRGDMRQIKREVDACSLAFFFRKASSVVVASLASWYDTFPPSLYVSLLS